MAVVYLPPTDTRPRSLADHLSLPRSHGAAARGLSPLLYALRWAAEARGFGRDMSGWCDRIDYPDLGPGWVRLSKQRSAPQSTGRQIDHMYVAPSGAKFRSIKQAMEYLDSGVFTAGLAPKTEVKAPAKKAPAQPRKQAKRSEAHIAKTEAAREAKAAAAAARLHAQNATEDSAVCYECGSGEEVMGNDILLCDGSGCHAAYHLRCLERPLFAVPEGDWLCPGCEQLQPAPPPSKLLSPHSKAKQLQPERQSVDGSDVMAWAHSLAACPPDSDCPVALGSVPPVALGALAGRACLYSAEPTGGERAHPLPDLCFSLAHLTQRLLLCPNGCVRLCVCIDRRLPRRRARRRAASRARSSRWRPRGQPDARRPSHLMLGHSSRQ